MARQESRDIDRRAEEIILDGHDADMEPRCFRFGKACQALENRRDGRAGHNIEIHRLVCVFICRSRSRRFSFGSCFFPVFEEAPRQADAVVELWEAIIPFLGRHFASREEIELVAEIQERAPRFLTQLLLPALRLVDDSGRACGIKLLQRVWVSAILRDADRHDGERERMGTPRGNLADRARELLAVIEPRTEHDLRVIIRACRFEAVELICDFRRALAAQHFRAELGIHALHGNVERRQMELLDAAEISLGHVCQRHEVAIEERQAIIVVLDGEARTGIGRTHVDEAEIAVVRAAADTVEDSRRELSAEFLVIILVERDHLLLAVRVLDEHVDFLVGEREAQVDDVAQRHAVDFEDLVASDEAELVRQRALGDAQDRACVPMLSHFCLLSSYHIMTAKKKE